MSSGEWNLSLRSIHNCTQYWDNPIGMQITPDEIQARKCEVVGYNVVATEKLEGSAAVRAYMSETGNNYDPALAAKRRTLERPNGMSPQQYMAKLNADPAAKKRAIKDAGRISREAATLHPGDPSNKKWDANAYLEYQSMYGN